MLSPSSSQSAASDEDPSSATVRVGAEGIGGDGRNREDILKEKPHFINTDSVSVSNHVYPENACVYDIRSRLSGYKFQNFSGGAYPQIPLVCISYCMLQFPPSDKKSYIISCKFNVCKFISQESAVLSQFLLHCTIIVQYLYA